MYLNLACFSSNQLENFPTKTCQSIRKSYGTARQPIRVHHFAYRPANELSHVINMYTCIYAYMYLCMYVFMYISRYLYMYYVYMYYEYMYMSVGYLKWNSWFSLPYDNFRIIMNCFQFPVKIRVIWKPLKLVNFVCILKRCGVIVNESSGCAFAFLVSVAS